MFNLFIDAKCLDELSLTQKDIENKIDGIFVTNREFEFENDFSGISIYKIFEEKILDQKGSQIGKKIEITDPNSMEKSLTDESLYEYLIVETNDWKIIPLENLIAKYDGTEVKIVVHANSLEDLETLSGILEIGVGGVIITPHSREEFNLYMNYKYQNHEKINLQSLEITSIESIGMGDRVCVDTVSILQAGEGMLVGSTSQLFVLVEAEVHKSGYVNPRPFRINAGAVSLYTLNGDKTNYLSELETGSEVSIINRQGFSKSERITRVKIERRPMKLIKVKHNEKEYSVVLQDAETVRLMTEEGSIPINEVQLGRKILVYISVHARHFGMKVDEFVDER